MSTRQPLIAVDVAVSLHLDLKSTVASPSEAPAFEIRELERDEMPGLLDVEPAFRHLADDLDTVAPAGWRCFVALDRRTPIHVSFVGLRPTRPLLFRSVTAPAARGRGAFRATVRYIAHRLHEGGADTLHSSVDGNNPASLRAHTAAGFEIARRHVDVRVLGISLRRLARRLVGRTEERR